MNAYQIADKIIDPDCFRTYIIDAVMMLRHQADYIDQLEKGLESSLDLNKNQAQRQEQVMELVMQKLAFEKENTMLHERVKQLEAQVYGGTTK